MEKWMNEMRWVEMISEFWNWISFYFLVQGKVGRFFLLACLLSLEFKVTSSGLLWLLGEEKWEWEMRMRMRTSWVWEFESRESRFEQERELEWRKKASICIIYNRCLPAKLSYLGTCLCLYYGGVWGLTVLHCIPTTRNVSHCCCSHVVFPVCLRGRETCPLYNTIHTSLDFAWSMII